MNNRAVAASYLRSLLWIAAFLAIAKGMEFVVSLIFIDFIQGNPHRQQSNALEMMLFTPLFAIIAFIEAIIVFGPSQCFQAILTGVVHDLRTRFLPLFVVPITAVLTWYCYDYLTPTAPDFLTEPSEYQHGFTVQRYMIALAIQAPLSVFSFLCIEADSRGNSKKRIILIALALAIVAGGIFGYRQR